MTYTLTDAPIANHTLATDQPLIENNNLYFTNSLTKDHQIVLGHTNATTFEGRHIQVCFNNRHGSAPTVAGIGDGTNAILYADNGNIFFGSVGAGAFQLTTFNATTANFGGTAAIGGSTNAGWTFLPGGLIFQYGTATVSANGTATALTFPINFPTACLNITVGCITAEGNSPGSNNQFVKSGSVSAAGFSVVNSSSSSARSIYWQAIGN